MKRETHKDQEIWTLITVIYRYIHINSYIHMYTYQQTPLKETYMYAQSDKHTDTHTQHTVTRHVLAWYSLSVCCSAAVCSSVLQSMPCSSDTHCQVSLKYLSLIVSSRVPLPLISIPLHTQTYILVSLPAGTLRSTKQCKYKAAKAHRMTYIYTTLCAREPCN